LCANSTNIVNWTFFIAIVIMDGEYIRFILSLFDSMVFSAVFAFVVN